MSGKLAPVLLACGLALTGCGGGGGDDGDDPGAPGFRITLDRSSVSFDFTEGAARPTAVINASSSGPQPSTLFVGAVLEGTGIDQSIPIAINTANGTGTITLRPADNLTSGQYTGRVQFLACSDAACNQRIGGTPIPVSFTVQVRRGLSIAPGSVSLASTSGTSDSEPIALTLPEVATTYSLVVPQTQMSWLRAINQTASGFTVSARSMPPGTYQAAIDVQSGPVTKSLPITYTVTAPPGGEVALGVTPSPVVLAASEGDISASQAVAVIAPSWAPDAYVSSVSYISGSNWLTTTQGAGGFSVRGDARQLANGNYVALVTVATVPTRDAIQLQVDLNVTGGLIAPSATTFRVSSDTTAAQLQRTKAIQATGGTPLQWTASTTADWLTLTRTQGTTGVDDLAFTLDSADVDSWNNFSDHTAQIRIAGAPHITPVIFNLTVEKRMAEVTGLGPYLLITDQPNELIVRGRGFSNLSSPSTRLTIAGTAGTSAQLVNDTELVVTVPSIDVGSRVVSVTNALGFTMPTKSVRAIESVDFAYASVPTTEVARPLLYDTERQVLYGLDFWNENTYVFQFDGTSGTWNPTTVPMTRGAIGLRPEGGTVLRFVQPNSGPRRLEELDPITLALRTSTDLPVQFAQGLPTDSGLLTGNDSRAWLTEFLWLRNYNLDTGVVETVEHGNVSNFDSTRFIMSRNGEHMVAAPFADLVPNRMFHYMNSADTVWHESGFNVYFDKELKINDDGSRVLVDSNIVLNEELQQLGVMNLPGGAGFKAAALPSPIGRRAYVLTVNDTGAGSPTVYVYDTSSETPGTASLPLLGSFTFADFPSLCPSAVSCGPGWVQSAISPDGRTLFFSGQQKFVVVPIPAQYL
jgi:hypothetical protein